MMEKIEGVDLGQLVVESSEQLIMDKRRKAAGIIKNHLQRVEQLALDVRQLEQQLSKKKELLDKAQGKINKMKAGDWSVLSEKKDGPKGHNQGGEPASSKKKDEDDPELKW